MECFPPATATHTAARPEATTCSHHGMHAEPYVTKALLLKLFGPELASEVAARYFMEGQGPGGFRFRPEYCSEKVGEHAEQPHADVADPAGSQLDRERGLGQTRPEQPPGFRLDGNAGQPTCKAAGRPDRPGVQACCMGLRSGAF